MDRKKSEFTQYPLHAKKLVFFRNKSGTKNQVVFAELPNPPLRRRSIAHLLGSNTLKEFRRHRSARKVLQLISKPADRNLEKLENILGFTCSHKTWLKAGVSPPEMQDRCFFVRKLCYGFAEPEITEYQQLQLVIMRECMNLFRTGEPVTHCFRT